MKEYEYYNEIEDIAAVNASELIAHAKEQAEKFKKSDKLKTNQIRNFYEAVNKTKLNFKKQLKEIKKSESKKEIDLTRLILLKPQLAYAAGRQKAVKENFYPFLKWAIEATESSSNRKKAMKNFFILVESIVAYHKFFGDK